MWNKCAQFRSIEMKHFLIWVISAFRRQTDIHNLQASIVQLFILGLTKMFALFVTACHFWLVCIIIVWMF